MSVILDSVATVSGVAAVIFAAYASWQAKGAREALVRERRIDWKLDILTQLSAANWSGKGKARDHTIHPLAVLLDEDLIPITRASVGLSTTPAALAEIAALPTDEALLPHLRPRIDREIVAAVRALLAERG